MHIFSRQNIHVPTKRWQAVRIAQIFYLILRRTLLFFFRKKNTRKYFNNRIALVLLDAQRTNTRNLVIKLHNTVSRLNRTLTLREC